MATASAIAPTAPTGLVLALLAALVLAAALRIGIAVAAAVAAIAAACLARRCCNSILRLLLRLLLLLLLLLLATRGTLPGLGAAFGGGTLAAIIRFVFGHGQSSLGAVGGTGGGKDRRRGGRSGVRLRALGLR